MQCGVTSIIVKHMHFDFRFNLKKIDKLEMFTLVNESEDLLAVFFELESPCSDSREAL